MQHTHSNSSNSSSSCCVCVSLSLLRHRGNGCVLVRCSQPLVGVLGWRCQEDEKFFHALAQSCCTTHRQPPPTEIMQREDAPVSNGHTQTTPSLLILDLRSYTAALGNRAKGGGCEHQDYYVNCEIRYKGLANIHSVRKSFMNLRLLLTQNRCVPVCECECVWSVSVLSEWVCVGEFVKAILPLV